MGLSLSSLISAWKDILCTKSITHILETMTLKSVSFDRKNRELTLRTISFKKNNTETNLKKEEASSDEVMMEKSMSFKSDNKPTLNTSVSFKHLVLENEKLSSTNKPTLNTSVSFKHLVLENEKLSSTKKDNDLVHKSKPTISLPEQPFMFSPRPLPPPQPAYLSSPRPVSELDAAAVKLQKVYKSYRTRRNLADCAVVVEELWWKALDFATLEQSSVSFFNIDKQETVVSRWARARTRAAKVGKGLSKDEKAQKLALQHWLEAIDPRHRYGHNLHFYYDIWFDSESTQPFFYWLDVGDGKEMNLEKCPRVVLQRQCIQYLGPKEREAFEVIVDNGKLVYRQSGALVNTVAGSKWIFVLSTSRSLYVGQKKKGRFQHSSFLAGGATTAAGRMVAHDGVLEAIWPYSGHYLPTEENFKEFVCFLEEHHVNLTNVKRCAADDDDPAVTSFKKDEAEAEEVTVTSLPSLDSDEAEVKKSSEAIFVGSDRAEENKEKKAAKAEAVAFEFINHLSCKPINTGTAHIDDNKGKKEGKANVPAFEFSKRLSCKWSTGAGPRIGCVRDYPADLQNRALEQVNLSPRVTPGGFRNNCPIPSPRPSPKIRLSPRLAYMGLPSPRHSMSVAN